MFSEAFCEPCRIRTCDRLLRREVLYPAELRALNENIFDFRCANIKLTIFLTKRNVYNFQILIINDKNQKTQPNWLRFYLIKLFFTTRIKHTKLLK